MRVQSVKFIIVGILNTLVGYSVYFVCLRLFDIHYVISLTIAHVIGVIHSYIWNNKWTFQAKKIDFESIIKFSAVYVLTFLMNLLLLSVLVQIGGYNALISQLFALFFTTLISFVGHKYWSFSKT